MPSPEHHHDSQPGFHPDRDPVAALAALEEKLAHLQQQLLDLKTLAQIEALPIAQLPSLNSDLDALETRLQDYVVAVTRPTLFWQVVRFVGLGIVLGMAVQAWIDH